MEQKNKIGLIALIFALIALSASGTVHQDNLKLNITEPEYQTQTIITNLELAYDFENNYTDLTGNSHTGIPTNVIFTNNLSFMDEYFIRLNGVNAFVTSNYSNLNGKSNYTKYFKINFFSFGDWKGILGNRFSATQEDLLLHGAAGYGGSNGFYWAFSHDVGGGCGYLGNLLLNGSYAVMMVFNSSQVGYEKWKIYVDNVELEKQGCAGIDGQNYTVSPVYGNVLIGKANHTGYTSASFDSLRIFGKALNITERDIIFNQLTYVDGTTLRTYPYETNYAYHVCWKRTEGLYYSKDDC